MPTRIPAIAQSPLQPIEPPPPRPPTPVVSTPPDRPAVLARIAAAERTFADGRIGWPTIVEYLVRIEEHDTHAVLPAPPTIKDWPDPARARRIVGKMRAEPPASRPYYRRIHDREAYDELDRSGRLRSEAHTGRRSEPPTPGGA